AIDGYMLDYTGRDASIVTRLSWWRTEYGHLPLADFTTARIKDGLRKLAAGDALAYVGRKRARRSRGHRRSAATINRYHAAISAVLGWCVDQSWTTKNAALGIRRKSEPRGRIRYLTDDERSALLAACDASEWADLGLLVRLAL